MNSLWPSRAPGDAMDGAKAPVDLADTGIAAETATVTPDPPTNPAPPRPVLQRNVSAPNPNPPAQPPPPPGNQPPDSLSLAQLRRFVSEFPRSEALAYDFVYSDTGPHAEEIDEWFSYQFWQWVRLNAAQKAFDWHWDHEVGPFSGWDEVDDDVRIRFVRKALDEVSSRDDSVRNAAIGRVAYLVLGRWCETVSTPPQGERTKLRSVATPTQLSAIQAGIRLLAELDGLPTIWTALQNAMDALWQMEATPVPSEGLQEKQDELMNLMTIMYMTAQETTNDRTGMASVRESLRSLDPDMATYMLSVLAKMRWLESPVLPMAHILLLLWKSLLVVFGGLDEVEETKKALRDADSEDKDKDTITASPLDYHVFRQEIASKYPAYVPPQLPLPLEADNTSLLPQLPNHPTRNNGSNGILPAPPNAQSGGASILHQPVHIATPAPSPPPSPSVGGKGGKKQNYQTNQNFPFMYPPLDATSNSAGGKGDACMRHSIVGRPWEGSDIPASILEAGELFSKRVRMTRATRQLWEERENFLKFERGWSPSDDDDLDSLDLDSLSRGEGEEEIDEEKLLARIEKREAKTRKSEMNFGTIKDLDETTRRRLEAVEKLYNESLPQLQSVVIVLMKTFLYNITAYSTMQQAQANGMANFRMAQQPPNLFRSHDSANGLNGMAGSDNVDMSLEDLDATRAREIESKALTGILLLLLKWFKLSHVLKFEYLTQLLLDSNYIPLVLKLFVHQDVQQVVDSKTDRLDHSFFHFCNQRASPEGEEDEEEESEDEAAPPPIKRRKSPPEAPVPAVANGEPGTQPEDEPPTRPEVDELGYPINPLPKEPITDFSRRNFFSLINYLRILQKICKKKAHRNLLLVQYKSSNIIRKSLKIPQPELRLYTLKLFKNQVPYCGRKWRQSNMRVITAVYLHCRPELRDEWLAGSDVDLEVEEALPLEQALRSLTHWFNVRHYPDRMWGGDVRDALQEEHDFFKRELEKLDVGWLDAGNPEMGGGEWDLHPGGWMPGWG